MSVNADELTPLECIRSVPDTALVKRLADIAEEQRFEGGETVVDVGQLARTILFVKSGLVGLYVRVRGDLLVPFAVIGPRGIVGVSGFGEQPEVAFLKAMTLMPAVLIGLEPRAVRALMLEYPNLSAWIHEDLFGIVLQRLTSVVKALDSEEVIFPRREVCPSLRATETVLGARTVTGAIRGLCERSFQCDVDQGKGCPLAGKPPREFHQIWPYGEAAEVAYPRR